MLMTLSGIVRQLRPVHPGERHISDARGAVGDRDAGQAGAACECLTPDVGNVCRDRIAPPLPLGYTRSVRLVPLNKTPSLLPVDGIVRIHRNCTQAGAAIERRRTRCW